MPPPARLVADNLPLILSHVRQHKVLDLACGSGRNGLFLAQHNVPVVFADKNRSALEIVARELPKYDSGSEVWQVDLEIDKSRPLAGKIFDVILVFNYLHRPLLDDIASSLAEGGLLLYETFTARQANLGRPSNPNYLLGPGELEARFSRWDILHYFEGADQEPQRFYASLVARKTAFQRSGDSEH